MGEYYRGYLRGILGVETTAHTFLTAIIISRLHITYWLLVGNEGI